MHNLSDKYKFCKRLINAMSSFGAKAVLRQDIVTKDVWIQNSSEICEYIEPCCDIRMCYFYLDAND